MNSELSTIHSLILGIYLLLWQTHIPPHPLPASIGSRTQTKVFNSPISSLWEKAPLCMSLLSPFFSLPSTSFSPPYCYPGVLTIMCFSIEPIPLTSGQNSIPQHSTPGPELLFSHLFPSFFCSFSVYLFIRKSPQSLDWYCLELSAVMEMFSLHSIQHQLMSTCGVEDASEGVNS